jgi:hypothetical protein
MSSVRLYTVAHCYLENARCADIVIEDVILCKSESEARRIVQDELDRRNKDSFFQYKISPVDYRGESPKEREGKTIARADVTEYSNGNMGDAFWEIREYEIDM